MAKRDIFKILDDIGSGLDELKDSLKPLAKVFRNEVAPAARTTGRRIKKISGKVSRKVSGRVSRQLSASVKQLRAMQGQYMGLIRRLTKEQQRRVKEIRKSKGYKEALRLARSLRK
jgi:hypothetical protein